MTWVILLLALIFLALFWLLICFCNFYAAYTKNSEEINHRLYALTELMQSVNTVVIDMDNSTEKIEDSLSEINSKLKHP